MPSVSILAPADKSQITRTTEPRYNPLAEGRRCGHCGQQDGWIRIEYGPIVGGWFCQCSPLPEITPIPEEMRHTCGVQCVLGGVA